jgi:hypothetical protein
MVYLFHSRTKPDNDVLVLHQFIQQVMRVLGEMALGRIKRSKDDRFSTHVLITLIVSGIYWSFSERL